MIVRPSVEDDDYSLTELSDAIVHAPRRDAVAVRRAFVRTWRGHVVQQTTQRIRARRFSRTSSDQQATMPLAIITPQPSAGAR